MKRFADRMVLYFCLTGFFFLCAFFSPVSAAEPIKIGAVLCLTGWAGGMGTPEKEAITVEVERVNRQGGVIGRQIEVYFEDDQSNPANAVISATKLIRDEGVAALIGSSVTNMCMPILPICEREGVVNVSIGAGHEITQPLKKWVFRIPITDIRLSPLMVKFAAEKFGAKKIALMHSTDASGVMGAKGVVESVQKYGIKIVTTEKFEPKDTNVMPQLTKVKALKPDAIILYASSAPGIIVAKNYQQLGMENIPVVASHGIPTREFIEMAGKGVEGRWAFIGLKSQVAEKFPADDPYRKNVYDPFMEALRKKYGATTKFNVFHGNGHDALHAVLNAIKVAGTDDRASLRNAMEKVGFVGLNFSFQYTPTDHDGHDERSRVPITLKNGAFTLYN